MRTTKSANLPQWADRLHSLATGIEPSREARMDGGRPVEFTQRQQTNASTVCGNQLRLTLDDD